MRKKLTALTISLLAFIGASAALAAPASAALPVKAGTDSCGHFNVWINGEPVFYYFYCGPDPM